RALQTSALCARSTPREGAQPEMRRAASRQFVDQVMTPAFGQPRGLPRLKALFENWRHWVTNLPGGCIFVAAAAEVDDSAGPIRDFVVSQQEELLKALARTAHICVEEGHFRRDLDVDQFAFDALGVYLGFHHLHRLLRDPRAEQRARRAFARLVEEAAVRQ